VDRWANRVARQATIIIRLIISNPTNSDSNNFLDIALLRYPNLGVAMAETELAQGILLKIGSWIYQERLPGLTLKLLLLALSLENPGTKKWIFQRPTLKNLLEKQNDGILSDAIEYWRHREVFKQIATPHKSSKHKITYVFKIDCPPDTRYFFLLRDLISYVGTDRKKQSGPALMLTNNGLRFFLFLHDEFSLQQSINESLKKGQDGFGIVLFDSTKAKEKLHFRNFHRYVGELEKIGLLKRDGYSDDGKPRYLLVNPYFKKRKQALPSDPPKVVINELHIRRLIARAEALELFVPNDRPAIKDLIMEYGLDWVEDAIYIISRRGKVEKSRTVEDVRGILSNWIEKGKLIGFHDDHIEDASNHETEELANLFFGRRPRMLEQHVELKNAVNFFDKCFFEKTSFDKFSMKFRKEGCSLLVEDFPGGSSFYCVLKELKQRFLVARHFDDTFYELCKTYGLKWVADAYATVRGDWPDAAASIPEEEKLKIVERRLQRWRSDGKWLFYEPFSGFFACGIALIEKTPSGETVNYRDKYSAEKNAKVYAVREPFWGSHH
jgi:hypothetical protein